MGKFEGEFCVSARFCYENEEGSKWFDWIFAWVQEVIYGCSVESVSNTKSNIWDNTFLACDESITEVILKNDLISLSELRKFKYSEWIFLRWEYQSHGMNLIFLYYIYFSRS